MSEISSTIFYLLGHPGSGKFTIAKELASRTSAVVFDNHLVNTPIFRLVEADGMKPLPEGIWDYALTIRKTLLEVLERYVPKERDIILTNALSANDEIDLSLYQEIEELAKRRGARLIPITLVISEEELLKRVVSKERAELLKLREPEVARNAFKNNEILAPKGGFSIEISKLDPGEAANKILGLVSSS